MNEELRAELLGRYNADQDALGNSLKINQRVGWGPIDDTLLTERERKDLAHTRRVQRENVARLREIVDEYGWPDQAMVGVDGAEAAWLLAQHADADTELQRRCVRLMRAAFERDLVDAEHLASLTDRLALADGHPQTYGTQLTAVDGVWAVRQPCDVDQAARLRAELGLESIEESIATLRKRIGDGHIIDTE